MSEKIEDVKNSMVKRLADKLEMSKALKALELKIVNVGVENKQKDGETWLLAKQPMKCFNCASCEANISQITPKSEFIAWNKYPHQDKNQAYRLGQGFSHMLHYVGNELVKNSEGKEYSSDNEGNFYDREKNLNANVMNSLRIIGSCKDIREMRENRESKESGIKDDLITKHALKLPNLLYKNTAVKVRTKEKEPEETIPVSEEETEKDMSKGNQSAMKRAEKPKIVKIVKKRNKLNTLDVSASGEEVSKRGEKRMQVKSEY